MSIFSRGSNKRKEFVDEQIKEWDESNETNYNEKAARDGYMKTKKNMLLTSSGGLERTVRCCATRRTSGSNVRAVFVEKKRS